MSQMEIDRVLAQIRTIATQVQRPQAPSAGVGAVAGPDGFAAVMKRSLGEVNAAQQSATQLATAFQKGVPGVELPQVMLEMQKASVGFRAVTEVRNRLVNVYQEIMNMPI